MYKSIDLFAGIGGIRLGFDQAFGDEIETVFVSEFDEPAQKTYRANYNDPFDIAGDITKIEGAMFQISTSPSLASHARLSVLQAQKWASKTTSKAVRAAPSFSTL